jgi:hypothetical protein
VSRGLYEAQTEFCQNHHGREHPHRDRQTLWQPPMGLSQNHRRRHPSLCALSACACREARLATLSVVRAARRPGRHEWPSVAAHRTLANSPSVSVSTHSSQGCASAAANRSSVGAMRSTVSGPAESMATIGFGVPASQPKIMLWRLLSSASHRSSAYG